MSTPHVWDLETAALPLPGRSCDAFGLLVNPLDKSLWMLDFGAFPSLWRFANDEWTQLGAGPELMPAGFSAVYSWSFHFYWDAERAAAVCFATGYGGTEQPVMGVWDGARFREETPQNAVKSSNRDAFVWDEGRNVLVHFVGDRDDDPRFPAGALHVRELDASMAWRDVGIPQKTAGSSDRTAAYDGELRATVCITSEAEAFAWNGTAWRTLPVGIRYPWHPYATARSPGTGALVMAYRPRETETLPAHVLAQRAGHIEALPVSTMWHSGGMAYDAAADRTFVFGPWFGAGSLQHTLGVFEKGSFSPVGRVVAGETPFVAPGFLFGDGGRSPTLYWLTFDRETPGARPRATLLPTVPSGIAVTTTRAGVYAIGSEGEATLISLPDGGGTSLSPGSFPERGSTCLGADYEGDRLLVVSGSPPGYGPFAKDAWLLAEGTWTKLSLTGAGPALTGASVTYDGARARWIVAGGRNKTYKDGEKTFETDEKKWQAFPTTFVDAADQPTGAVHVGLMAYDTIAKRTFCLAGFYSSNKPYVYEGAGVWRRLADTDASGSFDVVTRQLVWRDGKAPGGVRVLDLGKLLDEHAAASADQPLPSAKKAPKVAPPAPANEVWLRYQDDASDKLWLARLEGDAFTVRFGKRGAALQTKTTTAKSPALAASKYASLVAEKLAKGYEHAPEGEDVVTVPGRRAFHIAGKANSDDVWGGVPTGVSEDEWPRCAECSEPMTHVVTLHAHADRLPLTEHAALMAFVCGGELCEFWDVDAGANAVLLRTAADLGKPTRKTPPKGANKAKRWGLGYREVFEVDQEREPNAPSPACCDKVGGYPAWLQGDEQPSCRVCEQPMRFVGQLEEHDLNFTGGGVAYVFVCQHEHGGALFMQR